MRMTSNQQIRHFVRHILGCTCPDNVFDHIKDQRVTADISPHTRTIIIGGKLLLYIWEVDNPDQLQEGIPAILTAGKKERDELGLNRFRAVLTADNAGAIKARAELYFSQCKGLDDKIHLHVIPSNDLKDI